MMYYVYVLKDRKTKELYYGYTNNLERRLKEHNSSQNQKWILIYCEAYISELDARERERKLKHFGQSKKHLENRLKHSLQL